MNRLHNWLESGTPTIVLAVVVLATGIATGVYKSHHAPEVAAPAQPSVPATATVQPPSAPPH